MTVTAGTGPASATGPTARRRDAGSFAALLARAVADRIVLAGLVGALMIALGLMVGALWPSLQHTFADLTKQLPEAFRAIWGGASLATPVGWVDAELISAVAPIGAIAVGVVSAARAVAGEEEAKTMGVLLAMPVPRTTFLAAKIVAMAGHVVVVGVAVYAGLIAGTLVGDMGLSVVGMLAASASVVALGIFFGTVGVLIAAITGNRRLSTAATAGLAVLAFAVANFFPLSHFLASAAKLSPWYYFASSTPLANGFSWAHLLVLAAAALAVSALSVAVFTRRDLRG